MASSDIDFSLIFEKFPVCLMLVNSSDGTVHSANHAAHQLFARRESTLIGRTTLDVDMWADPTDRSKLMQELVLNGRLEKSPVSLKKYDGSLFKAEISIENFSNASLTLFLICVYGVEDDSILRLENSVLKEQLAASSNDLFEPTWFWSPICRTFNLSSQASILLSHVVETEDYLPFSLERLVHPADLETIQHSFDGISTNIDHEVRLLCGNGAYKWFRISGSRSASSESDIKPSIIKGILFDIHYKKLQTLEILKSSKRASLATSTANMGTWEVFPDGNAIWDPETYRLYGYDPGTSKLPQTIFREALTDVEFDRASRWFGKSFKYGLSVSIEFQLRWPDGTMRWLAAKGGAIYNSDNKIISLVGINWDVTDRRTFDDSLKRHQRELTALTSQLLEQEKRTTRKLAQVLHDQLGQTLTAARLLIDFQQQTQPTSSGSRIGLLLSQAMQQVRDLLIELRPPLLDERGLTIALDNEVQRFRQLGFQSEISYIVDPSCIHDRWPPDVEYAVFMIAREAIGNALTHSHSSLIKVLIYCEKPGLVVEVIDFGIGFSNNNAERLDGHLGLIGMKERAAAINARLSIDSQLGDGSRVKIMWVPAE